MDDDETYKAGWQRRIVHKEQAAIPVHDGRRRVTGIAIRHLARAIRLDRSVPRRPFVPETRADRPTGLAPRSERRKERRKAWKTCSL